MRVHIHKHHTKDEHSLVLSQLTYVRILRTEIPGRGEKRDVDSARTRSTQTHTHVSFFPVSFVTLFSSSSSSFVSGLFCFVVLTHTHTHTHTPLP